MTHDRPDLDRFADLSRLGRVCRLGLATRGNTRLSRAAVEEALARGVNYLNWCGHPDGLQEAVRRLGGRRPDAIVAVQLEARSAADARRELAACLDALNTEYLDVATYYYVEHPNPLPDRTPTWANQCRSRLPRVLYYPFATGSLQPCWRTSAKYTQ